MFEKLMDMIDEELDGAMQYAKCALHNKDGNAALAETFHTIAGQELEHAELLEAQAKKQIDDYETSHGFAPDDMKTLYDYLHRKYIDRTIEIRNVLSM